ncbi:MAG: sporulation protein YabP [Peptostreptococcales bacterium]
MDDKKIFRASKQDVFLENREKVSITEVKDVENFDEKTIKVITPKGNLVIKGSDLHLQKLDLEEGKVIICGKIDGINYSEKVSDGKKGILNKILK